MTRPPSPWPAPGGCHLSCDCVERQPDVQSRASLCSSESIQDCCCSTHVWRRASAEFHLFVARTMCTVSIRSAVPVAGSSAPETGRGRLRHGLVATAVPSPPAQADGLTNDIAPCSRLTSLCRGKQSARTHHVLSPGSVAARGAEQATRRPATIAPADSAGGYHYATASRPGTTGRLFFTPYNPAETPDQKD